MIRWLIVVALSFAAGYACGMGEQTQLRRQAEALSVLAQEREQEVRRLEKQLWEAEQ